MQPWQVWSARVRVQPQVLEGRQWRHAKMQPANSPGCLDSSQTHHGRGKLGSSRVDCGQALPSDKVVGRLDPQPLEHAGVKEAAKLAKAVQGEHHGCSNEAPKELPKHIDEGCVPIAVEDLHPSRQLYTVWHPPGRLQGLAGLSPGSLTLCNADPGSCRCWQNALCADCTSLTRSVHCRWPFLAHKVQVQPKQLSQTCCLHFAVQATHALSKRVAHAGCTIQDGSSLPSRGPAREQGSELLL